MHLETSSAVRLRSVGLSVLAMLLLVLAAPTLARALEPPSPGELEKYRRDGEFVLDKLAPYDYRVEFRGASGRLAAQSFDGQGGPGSADTLTLAEGQTITDIDATLAAAGHIAGTVRDADGRLLGGIGISVYRFEEAGGWRLVGEDDIWTDSLGAYDVARLSSGIYRVDFWDRGGDYAEQTYYLQPFPYWADTVAVTAGVTTYGIDATMVSSSDTTPPETHDDAPWLWGTSATTVRLEATDDLSGVARTEYSRNGGLTWQRGDSVTYRVWKRGGGSGVHTLLYRSTDLAGNIEPIRSCMVLIDARPPVTFDDAPVLPQTGATDVHLWASDTLSGIQDTWYSLDGESWRIGDAVTVPATSGQHWIGFYSTDRVGNTEQVRWRCVTVM